MYVLKVANTFFADKLCDIINLSFKTGIFPDLCKLAKVIPLFKKDNPLLCENYRPISLLPVYSKIFEKVIYTRMYNFLDSNNLIYERQFGFRSKHSTTHALISTTEWIKSCIDKGSFVGGIFIDLQKAFDTVNHDILCEKLLYYGFRGNSQLLIKSFLTNRKQFVSINGFNSSHIDITCGVPQGSTLGPLLFLLYINDLNFSLNNAIASHFADDTCIMFGSRKPKTLETVLNCDLKKISDWLKANRLSLNVKKSKLVLFQKKQSNFDNKSISIKLDGCKLNPTDNVLYLGVYIDNFVSWDFHFSNLSNKLSRANGILSKLRHFTTKETLLSVYYAIFYSHMTYGCLVWSLTTTKNIDIITILQKKCLRIINFAPFNSHTNPLFSSDNIVKFIDVIKMEQLKLVFQFKQKMLPTDLLNLFDFNSSVSSQGTRNVFNEGLFIPRIYSVNFGNKSLRYSAPLIWNKFLKGNTEINSINKLDTFKRFLKKLFLKTYSELPHL
jgi:hypothetical protein